MMNIPIKQNNISEYLLFLWQMEDLLRALYLQNSNIQNFLNSEDFVKNTQMSELRDLLTEMWSEMIGEQKEKGGHLQRSVDLLKEIEMLHKQYSDDETSVDYGEIYNEALPVIVQLRSKNKDRETSEIETCFVALYGIMLLKLQKKDISEETESGARKISALLNLLSKKYREQH